ncbi:MAG: Manganese transport protein MntH [uncultured Quadrisphaera sp.]|uniref:Manganese transport protein MntH n=1 Tax=uncultured Quadrisphaera sp. TaxID=904978 RepID=A0A6J4PL69_9ACTN|nr:MAG: Manganese transport protein MntH [uncultured Quadrisphaera sp.]
MLRTAPARRPATRPLWLMLGPAFVAAIAYVDPGNVAANLTAGARYGYGLLWVLVVANVMAVLVQYLSAKLGVVTGRTMPEVLGERLGRRARLAYWAQAEAVAAATDIAEVIGGAVALYLLFGTPLLVGGLITGAVSLVLLLLQTQGRQRRFEAVIIGFLAIIAAGFLTGTVVSPPDPGQALAGLVPRFEDADAVLLAASMLGATVMPHAIYLHSALARDHHGHVEAGADRRAVLRATRYDVLLALALAGALNISMLLLAASALQGVAGTDTLEGAHAAVGDALGPAVALMFALALLASGLASTSVGAYAGAAIMQGLLKVRIPLLTRRAVTLVPALAVLALGIDPTRALVISQVVLSFGIAFALVPLLRLTGDRSLMGDDVNGAPLRWAARVAVVVVVVLNVSLVVLTVAGL